MLIDCPDIPAAEWEVAYEARIKQESDRVLTELARLEARRRERAKANRERKQLRRVARMRMALGLPPVGRIRNRPVVQLNPRKRFPSIEAAAQSVGVWASAVGEACRLGYVIKGMEFRFVGANGRIVAVANPVRNRDCRGVVVDGVTYANKSAAARAHGVSRTTVCNWVRLGKATPAASTNQLRRTA